MLGVAEAQRLIVETIHPVLPRPTALAEATDLALATDLSAPISLPHWDNSAMDGYAVRACDLAGATENNPIHLHVRGTVAAGVAAITPVEAQSCQRIFTGAPIPPGADAVVMQESTRPHHAGYVAVTESVEPGENIRRAGEDVSAGSVVLAAGQELGPAQLALVAALGVVEVVVHPRPRVGVLVTGAELVGPGRTPGAGQIYDSNSVMVGALLQRSGCTPVSLGIATDSLAVLQEKMGQGLDNCDALITIGGVSVGEFDLVKDALREVGCTPRLWKVAMKPGKPFVFGERQGKPVFGLPGNPVSAFVTFLLLVQPGLRRLRGCAVWDPPTIEAEAAVDFVNRGERTHYMRAQLETRDGKHRAVPLTLQGSHVLSSLAQAHCLVEVPACRTLPQSSPVKAFLI